MHEAQAETSSAKSIFVPFGNKKKQIPTSLKLFVLQQAKLHIFAL